MKIEDHPMRAVVSLGCIWNRVIGRQMADLGLSSIQSRMLGYIYMQQEKGCPVMQKELEQEFQIRRSSVSSVLEMLERKGLIRRIPVPADQRQKELVLTERGVSVQQAVLQRLDGLESMVNGMISPAEREIWFSCIRRIETRLKEAEYD